MHEVLVVRGGQHHGDDFTDARAVDGPQVAQVAEALEEQLVLAIAVEEVPLHAIGGALFVEGDDEARGDRYAELTVTDVASEGSHHLNGHYVYALLDYTADELTGQSSELFFQETDDSTILAPADARVSHVGTDAPGPDSVGQYVVLDHGTGWSTVYHGLESVEVREGQRISRGDLIGAGDPDYDHDWDPMDSDSSFNSIDIVDNTSMSIVRTSQVEL